MAIALTKEQEKKAKDPSSCSHEYELMAPKWSMVDALLGGTATMRDAGRLYLPQHAKEPSENYTTRLDTTTLTNFFELTLDSLVGKPFSDPVKLKDNVPESVKKCTFDIDLQGNNLHTFCRSWFRKGLAKSFAHVVIDMPGIEGDREQRTLEDDKKEDRRPYWVLLDPENVIFIAEEVVNGKKKVSQVRIWEEIKVTVEFTQVVQCQVKVLKPGQWEIYRPNEIKGSRKKEWKLYSSGKMDLDEIPFVTFYTNQEGTQYGKMPLEDLAYLNIRHWQSTSDQINIITVARFPMLAVAGAHDVQGDVMAIGPKQLLGTKDPNGKFYYVEHSGKAIASGAADIEKLEQDMAAYGAEFLRKRPGGQTATARALDSAEATSPLQDITIRFMDAVNYALYFTAKWLDEEKGGECIITTDFGPETINDVDLRTINEARRNRDLSRQSYLEELKRRGMLADTFQYELNIDELQNEVIIESPFATGQNAGSKPGGTFAGDREDEPVQTPAQIAAAKKAEADKKKAQEKQRQAARDEDENDKSETDD